MNGQQIITHLATLALLVTPEARAAAPADGDNIATMWLLCPAIQLADATIDLKPSSQQQDTSIEDLLALNMSLADSGWAAQFKATTSTAASEHKDKGQQKRQAGTPQEIEAWTEAKATVDSETKFKQVLEHYGYSDQNQSKLIPLKGLIAQYAEAAFKIKQQMSAGAADNKEDTELRTAIKEAIYGHDGSYDESKKEQMGMKGTTNRQNVCTANEGNNPLQTISTMVACLCAVRQDVATAKAPCGQYGNVGLKWQAYGPPDAATWKKIRSNCPEEKITAVTADRIAAAVQQAKMTFYGRGNKLYVGRCDGTGCDGSDNTNCIEYAGQATDSVPKFEKAAWIGKLQTVESSLRARQHNEQKQKEAQAKIDALKQLVTAAAQHADKLTPPMPQQPNAPKLANAADEDSQAQKTTDCSKLEKAECKPDLGCKYNSTTTKCENDAQNTVSKTNKEVTGGTTNSEGKKCSGKKTERECKDGCKWDGTECKDSSILANKHFALSVVSAAFVALLF